MKRHFKNGDRVRSVYGEEKDNIGTVKIEGNNYLVVYDNEPEEEYVILNDDYFERVK